MGNLSTPKTVQKLQTALHAKAKAEADYRFYALYDKISREDILTHATDMFNLQPPRHISTLPCVDGSELARAFFTSQGWSCSRVFGLT